MVISLTCPSLRQLLQRKKSRLKANLKQKKIRKKAQGSSIFIKYNDSNIHALPFVTTKPVTLRNKKTGKKRTVMRVDTSQSPQDIQWLRPGWNEFPSHVWEQNKDHPGIKAMLKNKKIELMSEKVQIKEGKKKITKIVGPSDEEVDLKLFAESRAIEIVKETLNRDILQRWLDEETRHKVKRALTKQIEPLLNNTKDEDED
jgi:hypothetical protein